MGGSNGSLEFRYDDSTERSLRIAELIEGQETT